MSRTADAAGGGDERLQSARHDYGQGSVTSTGRSADHDDDGAITPQVRLKTVVCFVEIIQYQARVFVFLDIDLRPEGVAAIKGVLALLSADAPTPAT